MGQLYDSTDLYDNTSYTYEGAIYRTATGSGLSFSSASWNAFDPNDQYDEASITYDAANRTYDGAVAAQGSGSGAGSSSVVYVRTTFSTASASGLGASTAIGLRTVPKTATGTGGATAGDTAIGLRTVPRTATAAGVGTSISYGATSHLRTVAGTGTGSSSTVSFATLFRSASPSAGQGSLDVALWKNAGEYMNRVIRMRPVQGPGFRRKVNYSVKQ